MEWLLSRLFWFQLNSFLTSNIWRDDTYKLFKWLSFFEELNELQLLCYLVLGQDSSHEEAFCWAEVWAE